jgi:tol-pal system protein YbgF
MWKRDETMMRVLGLLFGVGLLLAFSATRPLEAASKEYQQMMANIRMLQQENQRLQAHVADLAAVLKAVAARIDEQAGTSRKGFADQKIQADTMVSDLRAVREKVDETNVRLGSLSEEVEALRVTQAEAVAQAAPPVAPGDAAAVPSGAPAPGIRPGGFGASPSQAFESARSDYYMGQWSLAIQGFESYMKTFPKSDLADDAQYYIGETCYMSGKFQDAVTAYDRVIAGYPASNTLPDAYYKRGLALTSLGQVPQARESFAFVLKNYPDSVASTLAKQALDKLNRPSK